MGRSQPADAGADDHDPRGSPRTRLHHLLLRRAAPMPQVPSGTALSWQWAIDLAWPERARPTSFTIAREVAMLKSLLLALLGLCAGLGPCIPPAAAQSDYPSRTVRIIVPATPGGGSDTF